MNEANDRFVAVFLVFRWHCDERRGLPGGQWQKVSFELNESEYGLVQAGHCPDRIKEEIRVLESLSKDAACCERIKQ